ncbi:MAG: UDP-3-O-acyl-N-acetylglucosamine deacetylase [Micavibrio sp.]
MQHTLKTELKMDGVGLHSGRPVTMIVKPAGIDRGIVFVRTDVSDRDNNVPARWNNVVDSRLCTMIGNDAGVTVGTIEHLMAALRGCGVDNAIVELNGPEVPVMDGSSAPFVAKIDDVGTVAQEAPRRAIKVLKEVIVEEEGKRVRLSPAQGSSFSGQIEFPNAVIGKQFFSTTLVNGNFRHDLAEARTFGFLKEVETLRSMGLALGGSLDNAIVLDDGRVMNEDGLRFHNEFIRHKLLDAVGDLFLAGGPIIGAYEGFRASHAMNNAILHKLFTTEGAWMIVDMYVEDPEASISHIAGHSGSSTIALA